MLKQQLSKTKRRIGISLNFMSMTLAIVVYEWFKSGTLSGFTLLILAILLTIVLWSFIVVYGRTGLWTKTHLDSKHLDERELQVHSNALRLSYSLFVIITLLVVYGYALSEREPIDVVIAGGLLYMAHILPASVIGWTEQEI